MQKTVQDQHRLGPIGSATQGIKKPEYSYPKVAAAMGECPIPDGNGVQAVMDSVKTSKSKVTLAKVVTDGSLIEDIDKSGYIAKLDGK